MIREFLRVKGRSLLILLIVWPVLVFVKYAFTDMYLESRYKVPIDLHIWFAPPAGVLWDWFDFEKKRKK